MSLSPRPVRTAVSRFFVSRVTRALAAILLLIVGVFAIHRWIFLEPPVNASSDKVVTVQEDFLPIRTASQRDTIGELLRDEHIEIFPEDRVLPDLTEPLYSGMTIYISHAKPVTIVNFLGEEHTRRTNAYTVGELMQEIGFETGADQHVEPAPETLLAHNMTIRMFKDKEEEFTDTVTIPFDIKRRTDDTLTFNEEQVLQEGIDGQVTRTFHLKYQNDQLVEKVLVTEVTLQEKQDKVVVIGTKLPAGSEEIQQGIASFYGGRFIGGRTASGETFTAQELTAAHLTLPFGTKVKVTNVNNGKSVIVTINDRGPYTKGRVIDLSEAAFELIGSLGSGVIPVKLETIGN